MVSKEQVVLLSHCTEYYSHGSFEADTRFPKSKWLYCRTARSTMASVFQEVLKVGLQKHRFTGALYGVLLPLLFRGGHTVFKKTKHTDTLYNIYHVCAEQAHMG